MSWLDSIVDVGKSVLGFFTSSGGLGENIVKTILTGYALNKVSKDVNKGQSNLGGSTTSSSQVSVPNKDPGSRIQIPASTDNRVPVVYGKAFLGGQIIDVRMSPDHKTMWFALAICEVTGNTISGQPSVITFDNVYYNGNKIKFKSDGITAEYMTDPDGNADRSIKDLVKVYLYNNGSNSPTLPAGVSGTTSPAYNVMPGWTSSMSMSNLVFAVVKITYSREKNITGLPNIQFVVKNSMTQPGDCLYDYMTNTRYGAGIPATEIKDV